MNLGKRITLAAKILTRGTKGLGDGISFFNTTPLLLTGTRSKRTIPNDYHQYIENFTSWVYAAISCIARNAAKIELKLYREKNKGDRESWERITQHPFLDLWNRPNSLMDIQFMRELTYIYRELLGNGYWYISRNAVGLPAELTPLLAQNTRVVGKNQVEIEKYEYSVGAQVFTFSPSEIIHFKVPNPSSLLVGRSPLNAILTSVDTDKAMMDYSMNLFENGAFFGTTVSVPADMDDLNYRRLQREIQEQFTGASNAGKTKLLRGGQEIKSMVKTMAELAFVDGRRLTKQDVLESYGVPAHKLGSGSASATSRATAYELDRTFSEETIQPKLKAEEAVINRFLLPLWADDLVCEFEDTTPADREFLLQQEESRLKTGYYSINQVRELQGDPPVAWGHKPWFSMGMIQASGYSNTDKSIHQKQSTKDLSRYQQVKVNKWNYFVKQEEAIEKRYITDLKEFFTIQKKVVLANIERITNTGKSKGLVDYIFPPISDQARRLTEASRKHIWQATVAGIKIAVEFHKGMFEKSVTTKDEEAPIIPPDLPADIPLEELEAVGFTVSSLEAYVNEVVAKWQDLYGFTINQTIQNDLRELLEIAVQEGWTTAHIQRDVEILYNSNYIEGMNPVRSLRIARTEVARIMNEAELECYTRMKYEYKTWSTALDERVCAVCAPLEMEHRRIDEAFSAGVMAGPVHPSCRCNILAGIWKPEEDEEGEKTIIGETK